MSNTIPIGKIAEQDNGAALASVSGMLENVWERKTGVTRGRPWSIQNLMLKDATGAIKVTVFGRKEFPKNMEGKKVEFRSVLVDDNTHNGKTTRTVKVTEDSTAKLIDNGQQGAPAPTASNSDPDPVRWKPVLGQTVGMAINNTIAIFISLKKDAEYYAGDDFIYDLHAIASSIIHASKALESGQKLEAPKTQPAKPEPELDYRDARNKEPEGPPDDSNFLQEGEELL